jgi:hypothetical protein
MRAPILGNLSTPRSSSDWRRRRHVLTVRASRDAVVGRRAPKGYISLYLVHRPVQPSRDGREQGDSLTCVF